MASHNILSNPAEEPKTRTKAGRPNVSFADDFDPRGLDGGDSGSPALVLGGSGGPRSRSMASPARRSSLTEGGSNSSFNDDEDLSKSVRRSTGTFGSASAPSRAALNPPHAWHPAGVLFRFTVLSTVAFILLAGYFSDETIGATNSELRAQMNLTPTEIGWIYSASYGPNIIMIFIGGFLVDRFGVRIMSLIYTCFLVLGLGIFAVVPTLWGKILGRIVFGAGFEPLEVCSDAIVMRWYSSTRIDAKDGRRYKVGAPSIPLAFSLLFSTGIFGQFLSLNVLPSVLAAFKKNLTHVYLLVTALGVLALIVNVVFVVMDWIGSRKLELESTASESISFKVLTHFPVTYWLLMGVCVAGYSCQYVFMIYASDYIHEKWGYDDIKSGNWASVVYMFAIVLSPVVGYFVERRGQGLTLMGIGCLFFAIGCVIMGTITPNYLPAVPLIMMGIAYSLVPATVWNAISDVIPEPLAGTGFGIMTAIMSFTYLIIPSIVGLIHDTWNSYENMNFVFAACAIVSFFGVLLIAKIEPDLNLPPRARRKDLSAYNVLPQSDESDEDEDEDDFVLLGTPKKQRPDDHFNLIRDRFAGPTSPQRRPSNRKGDETELLTVTEDEYPFSDPETDSDTATPSKPFSNSVIPDSWLSNVKRGLETSDNPVSGSLPSASFLRGD
jgi:MFS family permease